MIITMSQTCPACLWLSADDAEFCERCGEPFRAAHAPRLPPDTALGTARVIAVLFGLAVVGVVVARRFGDRFPGLWEGVKAALRAGYVWLLGPNEIFKPYLIIMLVVTMVTWVVLWLLARLR